MVVPVSQLVLPVGVMGLTVNGKTPSPEPGSIVRTAVVRFKWRQENTSYDLLKKKKAIAFHTQTLWIKSVTACTKKCFPFQGVTRGSQPSNTVAQ